MRCIKKKNNLFRLAIIILGLLNFGFIKDSATWQKSNSSILDSQINCIAIHPQDQSVIFTGTSQGIYQSINKGRDFRQVFSVPGSERRVHSIVIVSSASTEIYAATDSGLFLSRDNGKRWEDIFKVRDLKERRCWSVITDQDSVYLGTMKGLWIKGAQRTVWQKFKGRLGDAPVYFLAMDEENIYAATDREIFRIPRGSPEANEIFSRISHQENGSNEETSVSADSEEASYRPQIKALQVAKAADGIRIYVVSTKGIFMSSDQGKNWQALNQNGMPLEDATSLVVFNDQDLLLGTTKGVFHYQAGKWTQVYKGMETNQVTFLAADNQGQVYAGTDYGLFQLAESLRINANIFSDYASIENLFQYEPSINEVQQMAIRYAEVDPQKIQRWRVAAQKKAWLPRTSVGLSADKNRTFSDSIYGSSSSGGSSYFGPKDKTFYDNFGADISFSWNLGELMYSSEQTSIDSRSKMMVELREDILDQVTRLYFERRRTQVEIKSLGDDDPQGMIDRQMRVAELTALIDAFTGGEFSQKMKIQIQN